MAQLTRALTKQGARRTYVGWWRWSAGGPRSAVFSWARPSRHLSVLHKDKVTQTRWAKENKNKTKQKIKRPRYSDFRCLTSASFCPHDVIRFKFLERFPLEPQKTNMFKSFQAEMTPREPRRACKQTTAAHNIHSTMCLRLIQVYRLPAFYEKNCGIREFFFSVRRFQGSLDCLRPSSWVFFF